MVDGFEDKSGYACCIIAFMDKGMKEPLTFVGKTNVYYIIKKGKFLYKLIQGTIVAPRGDKNFGWDPIFQPEGYDKT